ncbi:diphosphomevalonate decarboxylase [Occultella glacieicola]|uniref:diphosphomevalonate decarboxylase n=1 Tax=Occultella glacieicola TaxID=2518684 RepID=A0ABY2DYU3_9MICO|nr:diphosphomevalonate decarboxylase [Occultella glacieicola]TDE89659.1 diphosphomevalonate decarboxylase [Occultella glacieicola]
MSVTAVAHPNIALIKYWGKADERLSLPATGSLSLTLDIAPTRTTVTLDPEADTHVASWSGEPMTGGELARVSAFLDLVAERAGSRARAVVETANEIPTGAGLASSAAGFAALAAAASSAYGLTLTPRELSRLARRGSGSASRSVFGGLVQWHPGDDEGSFAEPIDAPGLDLALVVAVLTAGRKPIGSREAMRRTVATSPFFDAWVASVPGDLDAMRAAIARADFTAVGELAESNAMRMHATMLGAVPPVRYWNADTVAALDVVARCRRDGIEAYATIDAGPNVKVLCRPEATSAVAERFADAFDGVKLLVSGTGPGVRIVGPTA